jgi:hypothetical protein
MAEIGALFCIKSSSFSEISKMIAIKIIKNMAYTKVPKNLMIIYLSSFFSTVVFIYNLVASDFTMLFFQS